MTQYGLALMLPPAPAECVLRARKLVLGTSRPYAPHLTVKSPVVIAGDPAPVLALAARIVARHQPIVVEADSLGHFAGPYQHVIFVRATPHPELLALHLDLVAGLGPLTTYAREYGPRLERDHYIPHITIAGALTADQLRAGLAALAGRAPNFRCVCTHVTLATSEDGHTWRLVADYPLAEAPVAPPLSTAHDTCVFDVD